MFLNLHPKCANPTCAETFEWLKGGKLFRFRRNPDSPAETGSGLKPSVNSHHVEHFWMCERCAQIYTLSDVSPQGVAIRALWPQLPGAKAKPELPACEPELTVRSH